MAVYLKHALLCLAAFLLSWPGGALGASVRVAVAFRKGHEIEPALAGYNCQQASVHEPWDNAGRRNLLRALRPGNLRCPGGTVSLYWDFARDGMFPDSSSRNPDGWVERRKVTRWCRPLVGVGARNPIRDLALAHNAAGFDPLFCMNLTTPGRDFYEWKWGRPLVPHPGSTDRGDDWWRMLADRLERFRNMLDRARRAGLPVRYVELGNELNFDVWHYNLEAFPDDGRSYARAANWLARRLKEDCPDLKIAAIGGAAGPQHSRRRREWNRRVVPLYDRSAIDALTLHVYGRSASDRMEDVADLARCIASWRGEWQERRRSSHVAGLTAAGWPVWITEFKVNFQRPSEHTWGCALADSFAIHTWLGEMDLRLFSVHQFRRMGNEEDGPNAMGRAMSLWGRATRGMTRCRPLVFDPTPVLAVSGYGAVPGLFGQAFSGEGETNYLIVNLTDRPVELHLAESDPAGCRWDVQAAAADLSSSSDPGEHRGTATAPLLMPAHGMAVLTAAQPDAEYSR